MGKNQSISIYQEWNSNFFSFFFQGKKWWIPINRNKYLSFYFLENELVQLHKLSHPIAWSFNQVVRWNTVKYIFSNFKRKSY